MNDKLYTAKNGEFGLPLWSHGNLKGNSGINKGVFVEYRPRAISY